MYTIGPIDYGPPPRNTGVWLPPFAHRRRYIFFYFFFAFFVQIQRRGNVVLLGDSLGDLNMAKGVGSGETLTVGFLNDKVRHTPLAQGLHATRAVLSVHCRDPSSTTLVTLPALTAWENSRKFPGSFSEFARNEDVMRSRCAL